jgi:hypothetical protein
MALKPGDIIRAYCVFVKPKPKHKLAVCLCPQKRLFFLINSEPRQQNPELQIVVKKSAAYNFLDDDSYINAATLCELPLQEISSGKYKGHLTDSTKKEIVSAIEDSPLFSEINKGLITKNLA